MTTVTPTPRIMPPRQQRPPPTDYELCFWLTISRLLPSRRVYKANTSIVYLWSLANPIGWISWHLTGTLEPLPGPYFFHTHLPVSKGFMPRGVLSHQPWTWYLFANRSHHHWVSAHVIFVRSCQFPHWCKFMFAVWRPFFYLLAMFWLLSFYRTSNLSTTQSPRLPVIPL